MAIYRRRWLWILSGLAAGIVIALIMVAATIPLSSDTLRHRLVQGLSRRLDADIELGDLNLRVFPRLRVHGDLLKVRRHGSSDEPLISVQQFTVDADLTGLLRKHVAHVRLDGLKIVIPPGKHSHEDSPEAVATTGESQNGDSPDSSVGKDIVVDVLESADAQLVTMPDAVDTRKGKQPRVWAIHVLKMHDVGASSSMPFDATLTNAVPPGEIVTKGRFGPWNVDDPGETPLRGVFSFDHADLGVFHGIAGTLTSNGDFSGSLDYIEARGQADIPNFTVTLGGQPFGMHTTYHTVVDGTNGDTYLKRVDASFLQSSLVASGSIYNDTPNLPGRYVQLDVTMDRGRIEDLMKMAVKSSQPPMTGAVRLHTKFLLPPGEADVPDRLQLDGQFSIADARFTNVDVQSKIRELSARSRGKTSDEIQRPVLSDIKGHFKLGHGRLTLPQFRYEVPGATIELTGAYALRPQSLDFQGTMLMEATVSQTQRGWKKLLLKAVDPLFRRKDGKDGSAIPFRISGTRGNPSFGLDYGRVFGR